MAALRRGSLLMLLLLAVLGGGLFYALVLHPGPDLRPQVEAFLRTCDAGQVEEAMAQTALAPLWGPSELREATTARRGILGRFEAIVSAEPLERVYGAGVPQRRMVALLRFGKEPEPVRCVFTFRRGDTTWALADFDIPVKGRGPLAATPERARATAEGLVSRLVHQDFNSVYRVHLRRVRRSVTPEDMSARLQPQVDDLGVLQETRWIDTTPQGAGLRVRVDALYDSGRTLHVTFDFEVEDGSWCISTLEIRVS